MDLTNIVLDIIEAFTKAYAIILRKPYITVKVQHAPKRDRSGEVTKDMVAFTLINEGFTEIDVQKVWFLTSFNRLVSAKSVDSKLPVKVLENDRINFIVPVEELKATLNKRVRETITRVVVFDKAEHRYVGRVDKITQEALAE